MEKQQKIDGVPYDEEEYGQFLEDIFDDLMRECAKRYLNEKRKTDPSFKLTPLSQEEKVCINDYFVNVLKFRKPPLS